MKLHLPTSLRSALLALLAGTCTVGTPARAAIMHASGSLLTYTDFGSNMGRYSVYQVNDLLKHLNKDRVSIMFQQGEADYTLPHGMISYESVVDGGPFTAIGYNVTATVQHNGVTNPTFTGRFIGNDNAIHYAGIEYRSCTDNTFLLTPSIDYKITRSSKLFTDITPTSVYDTAAHLRNGESVKGMLQYRMGGGYMQLADPEGNTQWLREAYVYVVGGIVVNNGFSYETGFDYVSGTGPRTDGRGTVDDSYTISITGVNGFGPGTAGTETHPLPFVTQGGDSGSPVWVWDTVSESYQLISCHQARGGYNSYSRGASTWTLETLESFCEHVDMDKAGHTVHIGAVAEREGLSQTIRATANGSTPVETTTRYGYVSSDTADFESVAFCGVQNGINTWLNLNTLKDTQKWYTYGNDFLNANNTAGRELQYADLFETENLIFESTSSHNSIILDADADLGIGYVQFSAKQDSAEKSAVSYTISSAGNELSRDYMLHSAGYLVDKDVAVHLQIANTETTESGDAYVREWRKTGDGDLYLEGRGKNEIFLNVGGKGTTYLQEKNGYAAYNVIINNGATVNLNGDKTQVARDVTFGYGGGKLDFAGDVTMDWYSGEKTDIAADAFTINALTQDAVLTNTRDGSQTTLTYRTSGESTFLGSFQDGAGSGALRVIFDGGSGSAWTLNSIHTDLQNEASGLTVSSGSVTLAGTLTQHAQGSLTGYNQQRYSSEDDWHYADAEMNVEVAKGAAFRLGSHARLRGDVTVADGGLFLMNEGVRHEQEYIEGWYRLESTYDIKEYYGLHGDVDLNGTDARMKVAFSEKTDADTELTGAITGTGGMVVETTALGSLTLSGTNTFSGCKELHDGVLILKGTQAAGDISDNKWVVGETAWLAVDGASAASALGVVDKASSGVLALTQNESGAPISLEGYGHLIVGAKEGTVIQFGRETGEENSYDAVNGTWNLGGGGGELVVNYALKDHADLVLGNQHTSGIVTLTNTANDIASIRFAGQVTLGYTDTEALGNATINLSYTNRIMGATDTIDLLDEGADGVLLLDKMGDVASIDLSEHRSLHLGAEGETTFGGDIRPGAETNTYYFGGITGHLTLTKALSDQNDGFTSLVLDGQTYRGGVLELTEAATLTGVVEIMGEDENLTQQGGTATLMLSANEALQDAAYIMMYKGGVLDINGTEQTLSSIWMNEGSAVIDSSETRSGVLTLNNDGSGFLMMDDATINVGTLIAAGENDVPIALGGVSVYEQFLIQEGTVAVTNNQALCATGLTVVEAGASLLTQDATVTSQLVLNGGELVVGDDSDRSEAGNVGGAIAAVNKESASSLNIVGAATISAVVDVAEGATLNVTADGRKAAFSAGVLNDSGGTINMMAPEMALRSSDGTTIGGQLNLLGEAGQMTLTSETAADNMLREFHHLNLENDLQLTLTERSRNTVWNIHRLSGSGTILWNAGTVHGYSSRMVLDGSNSFEGALTVQRTTADKTENGRLYGTFVELAHNEALQRATLALNGLETAEGKSIVTLAVNTDNAELRGLSGNEQSAVYAGAAVEGDAEAAALKKAPVSVRNATLTVTGNGEQTFAGNVYGAHEGNGLTLVMDGEGTQTFSGAEVSVLRAVAKQGRLELTSAHLDIADTATIYRGATLSTGDTFSLNEARTLAITGDGTQTAALDSVLTLNGGVLSFDGSALRTDTAALTLNGVNTNGHHELTVAFTSVSALQTGVTYKLTDGTLRNSLEYTAAGLDYLDATFGTEDGLSVTFNAKDGSVIWQGTAQQTQWNETVFGTVSSAGIENGTAIFNDLATSRNVVVVGARSAQTLLFDNTADYVLDTSQQGASLQTEDIVLTGTSGVKLGAAVNITGDVSIGAGSTLTVQGGDSLSGAQSVGGEGTLLVDWGETGQGELGAQVKELNRMEIISGTVTANATLGTASLKVHEGATLHSSVGEVATAAAVQLAGTLEMSVGNGQTCTLTTAIAAGEKALTEAGRDKKGTLVKSGNGRLYVRSDIAADTVRVESGQLRVEADAQIETFLTNVDRLEVQQGALAYIGHNACNINVESYVTDMTVDGGTLELAAAQRRTDTVSGDVKVTNGGRLSKIDGGLRFTGEVQLGAGADDRVTLYGNWGKGGMMFEGLVSGEGTVQLTHGSQGVETYTFSGNDNTFNGTYEVAQGVRLLTKAEQTVAAAESIDLKGGSLVLGHAAVSVQELNGTAAATVETEQSGGAATLTVTKGGTYTGSIGSGVSLVKQGSGTLELTGISGDFNGSVAVQNGTLRIGSETHAALFNHASELSIAAGAALQLGDAVTLSAATDDGAAAEGPVSFIVDGKTATMAGDGSTHLAHTLIDLAADTTLYLQDIVLAESSRITDDHATVALSNVRVAAVLGNNAALAPAPSAGNALQEHLAAGMLTLSNIENVTLTGEKMTINLSGITLESLTDTYGEVAIVLGGAETAATFSSGLDVAVTVDGATTQAYYRGEDYRVAYFDTTGFAAPEPATVTLSLTALAALAASRRRRKNA